MKPQLAYHAPNQTRAKVIDMAPYLAALAPTKHVSGTEALWSTLLQTALDSWSWRDPESLAALEAVVAKVRMQVLQDWQETGAAGG